MNQRVTWTPAMDRKLIRWSKDFVPVAEIAERLGVAYHHVVTRRMTLRRQGRLSNRIRGYAGRRTWMPDEDLRLEELIAEGYTVQRIAKLLNRTESSISVHTQRLGICKRRRRRAYSSVEVAALMGLGCSKTVGLWIERGWLKPIHGRRSTVRPNYVTVESLWAFVENPETFMAWKPERITDRDLKAHALEHRAKHPRWLSVGAVARRYHLGIKSVNRWIAANLFPLDAVVKYGNWWIREDALVGFTPPCERSRKWRIARIRYLCCKREAPQELIFSVDRDERICDDCRAQHQVRRLSNGSLFRVYPLQQPGAMEATS